MEPPISPFLFSILLFFGMLIMLETGRRLAVRRRSKEVDGERSNLGTIEGAVFRPIWFADGIHVFGGRVAFQ